MKKIFTISMLLAFATICSCQRQGSAAEQQLAQRKAELDARENSLDDREKAVAETENTLVERENALAEREKAVAEKEKAMVSARTLDTRVQIPTPDSAQTRAERDRRIQQLPPDIRALIPDPSQGKALERQGKRGSGRITQPKPTDVGQSGHVWYGSCSCG